MPKRIPLTTAKQVAEQQKQQTDRAEPFDDHRYDGIE
jgi:hypothetical protein